MSRGDLAWLATVLLGAGLVVVVSPRQVRAQVAFQPNVATLPDGLSLSAVPAVSADRRYVRLSVNPSFQTVDGFQTLGVPFAASGMNSGTGAGAAAGALAGAGFPGAGGFRSVGVPMGMNGAIVGGGMGSQSVQGSRFGTAAGANFGDSMIGSEYAMDDSWSPAPRRGKTTRTKAARTKKGMATQGPPAADAPRAAGHRAKP